MWGLSTRVKIFKSGTCQQFGPAPLNQCQQFGPAPLNQCQQFGLAGLASLGPHLPTGNRPGKQARDCYSGMAGRVGGMQTGMVVPPRAPPGHSPGCSTHGYSSAGMESQNFCLSARLSADSARPFQPSRKTASDTLSGALLPARSKANCCMSFPVKEMSPVLILGLVNVQLSPWMMREVAASWMSDVAASWMSDVAASWMSDVAALWMSEVAASWVSEVASSWMSDVASSWMSDVAASWMSEVAASWMMRAACCMQVR